MDDFLMDINRELFVTIKGKPIQINSIKQSVQELINIEAQGKHLKFLYQWHSVATVD